MPAQTLAILVKVNPDPDVKTREELRRDTFMVVSEFLAENNNDNFQSFAPLKTAWRQPLYHPYGVILGADDPALFMYVFTNVLREQGEKIQKRFLSLLNEVGNKLMDGRTTGTGISAFAISADRFITNPWLNKYVHGQFLHDCGLYSIPHGKCELSEDEQKDVIKKMNEYAFCVLAITD